MKPGDEWIVWIPPALGYGERATGTIPANQRAPILGWRCTR